MEIRRVAVDAPEYAQACDLRNRLLRQPLGLVLTPEELAEDTAREHFVAMAQGRVIGTVSASGQGSECWRIKQMAVDAAWQGRGVGARLLQAAERRGREQGATQAMLHARETARAFYEKQGYAADGAAFTELGLPHVAMVKALARPEA